MLLIKLSEMRFNWKQSLARSAVRLKSLGLDKKFLVHSPQFVHMRFPLLANGTCASGLQALHQFPAPFQPGAE